MTVPLKQIALKFPDSKVLIQINVAHCPKCGTPRFFEAGTPAPKDAVECTNIGFYATNVAAVPACEERYHVYTDHTA